ncbi:DMT family transporter [Variovorax saccharolyticus]|uniref:DMT family transporter n=1 Tax=Variovorax saccharolyticus TaxID=3053516 RepID=UPI0025791FB6|nr:DMT family transporter [Variovorax sp. J22R187]MDM0019026.1 DMT family transporter [Variovorax sp. J22R187]
MKQDETHARPLSKVLPLVAVLTLLWGTNWVLFPLAVREVSVWTFRSASLIGSGLLLLFVARLQGISLQVPPRQRKPLVAAAVTYLVVWNIGSTYAAILIPSGQAAVLGFTMPVWATLFSWLLFGEKPSFRLICSVLLAACGVALLAFAARRSFAAAPIGFVLGIAAGIGWACGTLILKRAGILVPPLVSTGWQLLIAAVPLSIAAWALGTREPFVPSGTTLLVIGYITVVPMALGNVVWFSIVDKVPASVSGLSTVMVPMVAMGTGAVFRGEPLGPLELAAVACCGCALLLVVVQPGGRARLNTL